MKGEAIFSRKSDEWETPLELFRKLDDEFHFDLDAAASDESHLCDNYFTMENDGLEMSWGGYRSVFCNPPYSKIGKWVKKCHQESHRDGITIVMLIPSRTDTRWFHDYIQHRAEVRFIKGGLRFSGASVNAPFPSMIVIFRGAGA